MSRIGNAPIKIDAGVTVEKTGNHLVVKGAKGSLEMDFSPMIQVEIDSNTIFVKRSSEEKQAKSLHGLTRALIANMVVGVTTGWNKKLELVGVGYRVAGSADKVTLSVGYSHTVEVSAPEGISFEVTDTNKINVLGIDKILVGQTAAKIKQIRPPEVYKGKGIRYEGEYIRKKAGKAAAGATK